MSIYRDTNDGRRLIAVQIMCNGESVGWVAPDDWHAYLDGEIDAQGLCLLAALCPEPPAGAVTPAPARFIVEHIELS
jgi:hypothetical protein